MYEFKTALDTNTFVSIKILEALMQKNLTEEDKARIIAEGFAELEKRCPDLKYLSTKQDLSEIELKLIREIEATKKEIKELDLKLTKEISSSKFTIIKWVAEMMVAQVVAISGMFFTVFRLFGQ